MMVLKKVGFNKGVLSALLIINSFYAAGPGSFPASGFFILFFYS